MGHEANNGGGLLQDVLQSRHCMACKACCKYGPDDMVDAPMFTQAARDRIIAEFPERQIQFQQVGVLWQIVLKRLVEEPTERYICPVYDPETFRCDVYEYRPFDCATWPFYIMKKDGRIVIALSKDCPVVIQNITDALLAFVKTKIGPFMVEQAKLCPDLITVFHGNTEVILDVTDEFNS